MIVRRQQVIMMHFFNARFDGISSKIYIVLYHHQKKGASQRPIVIDMMFGDEKSLQIDSCFLSFLSNLKDGMRRQVSCQLS